jgi:serine/threonine protein kinase/mono/diheme cytochrome c family protein
MRIGKYELRRQLGQGGFGMVYVARDTGLDRDCALKFLLPEHTTKPELLQRFLQEARSAAKIDHLGIVTVFECGQVSDTGTPADGMAFIAMELLKGESLAERLAREGALSAPLATGIARQIASALQAAHAVKIVHRDLKPDNVFLVPDAESPIGIRVKVLDFGIAKLAEAPTGVHTASVMIFGTPRYMSPEQCRSSTNVDARSDVYALGVMLFEMLCGERPFDGEAGVLIGSHQFVAPPTLRSKRAELPEAFDGLVADMLAKQPEDRPSSMDEVIRRLEPFRVSGVMTQATPSAIVPAAKPPELAPTQPSAPLASAHSQPAESQQTRGSRRGIIAISMLGVGGVIAAVAIAKSGGQSDRNVESARDASLVPADATVTTPPVPKPDRGKYLAGLLQCGLCHDGEKGTLAGGRPIIVPGQQVRVTAPNLTPHAVGPWSDAQLRAAITECTRTDRALSPAMPCGAYAALTNRDLDGLVGYLRTVVSIDHAPIRSSPVAGTATKRTPLEDSDVAETHGRYLATVMRCASCHTTRPDMPFAGGVAPNLTPDAETGLGKWSAKDIETLLRTSTRPDGTKLSDPAHSFLSRQEIVDADIRAVVAFLKALPPIKNKPVPPAPPTAIGTWVTQGAYICGSCDPMQLVLSADRRARAHVEINNPGGGTDFAGSWEQSDGRLRVRLGDSAMKLTLDGTIEEDGHYRGKFIQSDLSGRGYSYDYPFDLSHK